MAGVRLGHLTIHDDASANPQIIELRGVGTSQ
jgi:hypothetical protein